MIRIIAEILHAGLSDLFESQPDILEHTDQTRMTEWNFQLHFANSLSKYLFWYDYDNDVIKTEMGSERPDTIFHKRKSNMNNFLVIESKKSNVLANDDENKINNRWFADPLFYTFGACVSVAAPNQFQVKMIENTPRNFYVTSNKEPRSHEYRKLDDEGPLINELRQIMSIESKLALSIIRDILERFHIKRN